MVSALQVAVATSRREKHPDGTAKKGLMWDVPLMLGACKEGSDRHRIQCMVFDFVVHPDTSRMALNNAAFKVRLCPPRASRQLFASFIMYALT